MPIRSIDDLRSAVGKDWDSVSDEDLIKSYADSVKLNPIEVARTLGYDPGAGGRESKRTTAAISNYVGNLQGVGEEVSGALGLSGARDYLAEKRRANEFQAGVASARARDMGAIESYKDVNNLSDFGNYAVGLGIQSAPYLGEAALGGIGVRAAMGGTRAALAAAEASGDVAAAARAKRALSLGSDAGVVAATYPSAVGDVLSNQREQTGGKTDIGSAALLAVPYAALNVVGVEGALGKGQLFRNPLNLLDNVSGLKGGLARTAATGTTTAFKEGLQETSQEAINQAGRMAVDPTEQFFNEKSNERFKESFVGGATLGGFIGGVAGGWRRSESFVAGANTGTNDQTGQQSTNDIQQTFQQTSTGTTPLATPIASNLADQMAGSAGRENPLAGRASLIGQTEPQTTAPITPAAPAVNGGTTDIAQAQAAAQQQNQQQTQADFAAQQQQKEAERAVFMAELVGLPNPEGQRWDFFGKPVFGPAIQEAAAANAQLVGSMNGTQARITRAINIANNQTGGKLVNVNFNPLKAADSVRKTLEKVAETAARFQIAHVGSVEEAAQILEQLSQSAKGAQLEQINAIHQALTGTDTTGYTASQQTKGATNEPKLQTTAGVGTVPVQGGTGEGSSGNAGDVQPSGVQSLLTGSQPQGQTGQQTGQPSGEGVRTGTSVATDVSGGQPTPGQVNEQQTSGVGEGQAPNQPQQTATGTVGEQTVQNGPRTYSPTIGYYASDLAHISSERRIEIIRELFNKVLATTKGANAETRGEILRLALLEQFSQADIAELVGMSEAAVQKQLERMSIKMDREIGQYVVTDPTIALKIVDEAANFRSAEFPDGIGEGELAGLYATRSEYETNKSQTLAEELEQGEQEGDRSKLLAEEMQRGEGGEDRTMGTIGEAGGSQGAVDTEGQAFFAKMEKLKAELDALPPKDPRRAQLEKKIKDQWTEYGKQQATRGAAGEITVTPEGEEDAVQEQGADEGDVRQPAEGGEAVGKGNAKPAKPARKAKQAKVEAPVETKVEEVKTPKEQWDELRTLAPELPAYDSLNKDQKIRFDDLANRGKANLAAVVNQIVTAPATEEVTEQRQTIEDITAQEDTERFEREMRAAASNTPSGDDVKTTGLRFVPFSVALDIAKRAVAEGVPLNWVQFHSQLDLTADSANRLVEALSGTPQEGVKFGKSDRATNPYSAQELIKEIASFVRVAISTRKLKVVDSVADLLRSSDPAEVKLGAAMALNKAFGVAANGRAYLIANRINKGQGRAKFMHEVGAHLGMEGLLTDEQHDQLTDKIFEWAKRDDDSREATLARRAITRAEAAETPDEDLRSEILAYFVEEAVQSGVEPSAVMKLSGPLGQWFRTLYAAFKTAIRKLGMNSDKLNAQDVVNMAYGAARLEMAGTYHGTAADFRRFNHKYMGTGEGAQAYGWGTYLAQRFGIAKGYWEADVQRKTVFGRDLQVVPANGEPFTKDEQEALSLIAIGGVYTRNWASDLQKVLDRTIKSIADAQSALSAVRAGLRASRLPAWRYEDDIARLEKVKRGAESLLAPGRAEYGKTYDQAPSGNVMRVDVGVDQNELLDYDAKLSKQPAVLQKIIDNISPELREQLEEEVGDSLEDMTGDDFYRGLEFLEKKEGRISEEFKDVEDFNKRLANAGAKQLVSTYLDERIGIPGLKFLDNTSRRVTPADDIPLLEENIQQWRDQIARWKADKSLDATTLRDLTKDAEGRIADYEQQIAKIKNFQPTQNLVIFNDKNIFRVGSRVGNKREGMKFGIDTANQTINRLPPFVRTPTRNLVTGLLHQAKNGIYASAITEDVVKMASKYMKSAKDYLDAQYARQATRIEFEQRINKILSDYDKLSDEFKGTGANSVNKFIKDSTVSGKWGYYPGENRVGTELFTVDPDMKLRFDAFDESAQNVIKAVFEHGYDALMLKKKAVEAAIDREFADREKAAMGDTEQLQELAKEKKLLLAREAKIRGIDISSPYAYLGRYGDYVVVAKSAEFKHYEERAKLNDWDVKQAKQWLQDNISNSDHYVVQFAETQAEADTIAEQLHATGNYDIMPEDAGVKEAEESYTGGGDIHLAVGRLRNLLQRQVSDGDMSSANFQSMNKMVGDLYLMTVAESSARKSLLQRKNVAGADDNMMRNLATSGRADAHFLSTLEHNDAITDSMERMRTEAKNQRREAMPLYNELAKRQANSMEYKTPSTLAIALNRMNTIWSLTFSPAYYLQQTLQTAMISVPYLAGRLGYGTAVSQVNRGYKDMAGLVKGLGVNDHIDFSKAPADVRDMLNKLVGMGKIDISMDADERATADEKGILAKVMYKMQGVNNRIEAVNRSVAAIAAYRGYLARYGNNNTEAATQYAAQVVSDTHGSYDGFNTPRLLAGNIGRVVGQFRRFQIIQLSMLARLMNNAFKGTSADEKMVARKALGFITAQMAVVGGAMAVPFVNQIAWMMSKILGDPDEPDDFEFKLRRLIDNKVASDLLLRGVPAALGVDVSDKLGMGRVASILPFSQGDLTSRAGAEKVLVAAMGPSANMAMKFADSFGMVLKGDYYKGLEMALPNGFANVMKAGRFASEGITMRNGDLVLKPEDFSMVDAAFQAVGLPTNTVTNRQFTQNVKAEYDKFYAQRSADIKSSYVKAYRDNDSKGMADAREEFQRMEDSRVANGYKRQPMSDLFKAPMEAMKRERGVIGGVETSKQNRRFVEQASQI